MAKLKLNPEPTFKAAVNIPVAGADAASVEFTFKHRTRAQLAEWLDQKDRDDTESVMGCAMAWDLDDEFNAENVARLCENYVGSAYAVITAYLGELRGARVKN